MPEQDTLVKTSFYYNTSRDSPATSFSKYYYYYYSSCTPFSAPLPYLTRIPTTNRTVVVAQHSRSFIRHLDLPQHRSTAQPHLEPTQVLRPTICLERAAAVKVLLLSSFRAVTLYDRDRLLPLAACDQTEDEILRQSVHNVLIHSMHATTRHVPLLCPSTGICPL